MQSYLDKLKQFIIYWKFRYELITNIYMMEPWEKYFINGVLIILLTILGITTTITLSYFNIFNTIESLLFVPDLQRSTTEQIMDKPVAAAVSSSS